MLFFSSLLINSNNTALHILRFLRFLLMNYIWRLSVLFWFDFIIYFIFFLHFETRARQKETKIIIIHKKRVCFSIRNPNRQPMTDSYSITAYASSSFVSVCSSLLDLHSFNSFVPSLAFDSISRGVVYHLIEFVGRFRAESIKTGIYKWNKYFNILSTFY